MSTPPPTTQPAGGAAEPVAAGPFAYPTGGISYLEQTPAPNPVLLGTSLIAVPAPKPRKFAVHDIITVIVREDRRTVSDAKMKSEKSWELESALNAWIRFDESGNLIPNEFARGIPGVDFEWDNSYDTKGKSERKDSLVTRIAAKVIDVKPNGNLIVQAKKRQKVGEETLVAMLTGECSSEDVTPQRTILSTQIYNLQIDMPDRGAVRDATRRGWLMRALDLLRPF